MLNFRSTKARILTEHLLLLSIVFCCVLLLLVALRWYRAKSNIQAEVEEMQKEQRSLPSVRTVSVYELLRDRAVRWQFLSVIVINMGMQLSGIDAVSQTLCFSNLCLMYCLYCIKILCSIKYKNLN